MEIEIVVEIPKGSRNKYEIDHDSGVIWLDRTLFTATRFPADYGFVANTLAEDEDPLDALVLTEDPTFPGCHVLARPVGIFWMTDERGPDAKVLCVPANDPRNDATRDIDDLPQYFLEELTHFFAVYKQLEPGKTSEGMGWEGAAAAEKAVIDARDRYTRTSS
jgi:inorganic pyrophosphatase